MISQQFRVPEFIQNFTLVVIEPSPFLSKRAKASLNQAICSSLSWSAIKQVSKLLQIKQMLLIKQKYPQQLNKLIKYNKILIYFEKTRQKKRYAQKMIKKECTINYQVLQIIYKMIEQLKISTSRVFLQGMSLKGSFFLTNPNEHMAINFDIEPIENQKQLQSDNPDTTTSIISILSIFPKNGLLMKKQWQKITIKAKSRQEFDYKNFLESHAKISVKYSLNNNFNKLLVKNKKIQNLSSLANQNQLQKYEGIIIVNVEVGTDHIRLKDQIYNQVVLGSTLGKSTVNISRIVNSYKISNEEEEDNSDVCTIINSLQLNSKIKQNSLQQSPSLKKEPGIIQENILEQMPQKSQFFQSFKLPTARAISFSRHPQTDDKTNNQFSAFSEKQKKGYNFELIIMAIIAAFFFSIGNNIGYLIKN